jgi:DNA ligase-1
MLYEFAPLYCDKDGTRKTRVWIARVRGGADGTAVAEVEHGAEGGIMQTATRTFLKGKNAGRSNATDAFGQALAETKRRWLDKKEKEGYTERGTAVAVDEKPILPMLAKTYQRGKKCGIVFPCLVQPKLDGVRCLFRLERDGRIVGRSRTGGEFTTVRGIAAALEPVFRADPSVVLDGELYSDEMPFQELAGLVKKKKDYEDDPRIRYHVFDLVDEASGFRERLKRLGRLMDGLGGRVCLLETREAASEGEAVEYFRGMIEKGYEGLILRNSLGGYAANKRSADLQKYKEFMEEEFPIVGYREAEGPDAGTVIWVCRTEDGQEFSVRPRGTRAERAGWLETAESAIGKPLTVIFQERTEGGIPRFPVGKAIRDGT